MTSQELADIRRRLAETRDALQRVCRILVDRFPQVSQFRECLRLLEETRHRLDEDRPCVESVNPASSYPQEDDGDIEFYEPLPIPVRDGNGRQV